MLFRYQWQIQSRAASLLFTGAVLLFISYIFVALSAKDTYYAHRLATDGRMVTATVIKKILHRASNSGISNTSYEVTYFFGTLDGGKVVGSYTVDSDTWERTAEHDPVEVQYSASDPAINRIGATTGVTMIGAMWLIMGSILGLLGVMLALKGLLALRALPESAGSTATDTHAVTSLGRTIAVGPPLLQFHVRPWIVIGGILLVCGVTFLLLDVLFARQERLFHDEGLTTTALVLTKSSHIVYNKQNGMQERRYDVGYRFTTQDGKPVQATDEIDWEVWESIQEREPIQIVYLPGSPARSRLVASGAGKGPAATGAVGAVFTATGALLLGLGFYRVMRKRI
jgi:Protein of unknown function (DUF3592)